jgi:hypothetical protein
VPGARNAEAVGLNKNHINMIKFDSVEDDDFSTVALLLQGIGSECLETKLESEKNIG